MKKNSSHFTLVVLGQNQLWDLFPSFCGLAKRWLSRCDFAQRKNRLRPDAEFQRFPPVDKATLLAWKHHCQHRGLEVPSPSPIYMEPVGAYLRRPLVSRETLKGWHLC